MTTPDGPSEGTEPTREFAHASEAEMARILDFYAVRWEYEPRTFPILWNLDGAVVESFAPDFYLPDLDLYLEMTTLRQKLVRKKNRKLRRLRELYPDIRIKLFYARDFRALMLKYGKLALVDELSGTPGQVGGTREAPVTDEPSPAVLLDDGTPPRPPVRTTGSGRARRLRRRAAAARTAGSGVDAQRPARADRTDRPAAR